MLDPDPDLAKSWIRVRIILIRICNTDKIFLKVRGPLSPCSVLYIYEYMYSRILYGRELHCDPLPRFLTFLLGV